MTWLWWVEVAASIAVLGLAMATFAGKGYDRDFDVRRRTYRGVSLLAAAMAGFSLALEVATGSQVFGFLALVFVLVLPVMRRVERRTVKSSPTPVHRTP